MQSIETRLKSITYQMLKGWVGTDAQRVAAVQSIFDAAIDSGTVITEPGTMPLEACGVTISWDGTGKIATFTKDAVSITSDNLADAIEPDLDVVAEDPNLFKINGEAFQINGEDFLVA